MAGYPTPGDYQEALQFPETAFADPVLAAGEPATNALGLPQPITGAFAAVFPIDTAEGRFAVRCFLSSVEDQAARYRAIAKHLTDADLASTVAFDYQDAGVRVGGNSFPLLKMAWAEGENLVAFVERHLDRPDVLRALADAWHRLLQDLAAAGIAHGDLQHGNVLVRMEEEALRLVLVDYDAMFVPALNGRTSAEVGHRNYQHPDRTEDHFDETLDHFAGLVVYVALQALAEEPALWTSFSTGENLLFQAGDFYDPDASPLFDVLREVEAVRPLAEALATACLLEPEAVPSLDAVLRGEKPSRVGVRPTRRAGQEAPRRPRSPFERAFLPASIAVIASSITLSLFVGHAFALGVFVVVAAVAWWMGQRAYGALSVVRRRRRTAREAAVLQQWIADLENAKDALETERRDLLARTDALRAERLADLQADALENHLRHHFIGELDALDEVGHRAVVRMKAVGIRNAFHATRERVAEARDLSTKTRDRIAAWRDALAADYAGAVPDALSPAEEQRVERQIDRRLRAFDAEASRLRAKADVQRGELQRVLAQRAALPDVSPWHYGLYLLRLRSLPTADAPSAAPILQRPDDLAVSNASPTGGPAVRIGRAETSDDLAWWEQV